jgi:Right handed beta helix region/FG-GAP-like repeat
MTTVNLNPTQNVAAIVNANAAGTTFVFAPGLYNDVSITPKNGDSFIGEGSVTLTGSIPITGWASSGGYWSAGGFPANGFSPGTAAAGRDGLAQVPEDLYVNGTPYLRVGTLAAVGPGDFYYSNGRVYISDNPTGKTATAGNQTVAFDGKGFGASIGNGSAANNVTIQNMTIEQYAGFAGGGGNGAIEAYDTSGWNINNVNAIDNHAAGLDGGSNMTVTGGNYSNNGEIGILDYAASNVVINGVTADNNNYAGYDTGWGGGGIKILTTNGAIVENSQISNNLGDGLWFDTDNQNVSILNNTISDNQKLGIEYEASYRAVISGNTLSYNAQSGYVTGYWGAGLLIQDSESVSATHNLVIANAGAEGIGMMDDTRPPDSLGTHAAINNIVEYNTIVMLGFALNGGSSDGAASSQIFKGTNVWDYNTYVAQNAQLADFTWNSAYWAAGLTNPPIDAHGTFIYQANPLAYLSTHAVGATANPPPTVAIASAGGTVTSAAQTIGGTVDVADAGSTVTVLDGTTKIGTATVSGAGAWSTAVTLANDGANVLTAADTNAAGMGTSNAVTYTLLATTVIPSLASPHVDFNDDGHPDILWQNTNGQAAIWEMNGTNILSGTIVGANPGPSWKAIGTGDFNDDGHSDILWQNTNGQAAIWEMNGTNVISEANVGANPGQSWTAIGTGDFNDDGHSDILWQNTNGQAAIWEMNGTNILSGTIVGANPGPSWKAIGTGDFNDDGHSDILWQNTNGQAAIWEMNGTNILSGTIVGANPGPSWKAIGTGDFNDDGHSDILWQNTNGQAAIWEMNGTNVLSEANVGANPGPSWLAKA